MNQEDLQREELKNQEGHINREAGQEARKTIKEVIKIGIRTVITAEVQTENINREEIDCELFVNDIFCKLI